MRDQIIELCQAKRDMPSHYSFESGSLDTLMRIVDCTSCLTIIPEMAVEYIPADHRDRLKMLAKGATSRKIAVAVRRTYVKSSIIKALTDTIMANAPGVGNGRAFHEMDASGSFFCRARFVFRMLFYPSRPMPRRHPRSASVAVPVCAVSPLRFASHCLPLSASCRPPRFADGRRRRILRTVWRGICAGCGALAAFPCVAAIPVGTPARFFVALNFQISFYFRTFARL